MGNLSKNFNREEFECKCGCGYNTIKPVFVFKLQYCRDLFGKPMQVISGCRCEEHNKKVGGADNSEHMTGQGADIFCDNSADRYKLVECAFDAGINRVGVAGSFVHLGCAMYLPQRVMWMY